MELVYCCIESFGGIRNQQFNFNSKFSIYLEKDTNTFYVNNNHEYIDGFFNINGENVKDIKAIIGKNGVGKTTLLEYIKQMFMFGLVVNDKLHKSIVGLKLNDIVEIFIDEEVFDKAEVFINNKIQEIKKSDSFHVTLDGGIQLKFVKYSYHKGIRIADKNRYKIVEGTEIFKDTSLIYYSNQMDFNWNKVNLSNRDVDIHDISLNNRTYFSEPSKNYFLNYEGHIQNHENRFLVNTQQKYLNNDIKNKVNFLSNISNREYLEKFLSVPTHLYIRLDYMLSKARESHWGTEETNFLRYERTEDHQFFVENYLYHLLENEETNIKKVTIKTFLFRVLDSYFRDIETFLLFDKTIKEFKMFENSILSNNITNNIEVESCLNVFQRTFDKFIVASGDNIGDVEITKFSRGFKKITDTYLAFIIYLKEKFFNSIKGNIEYIQVSNIGYKANSIGVTTLFRNEGYIKLESTIENIEMVKEFIIEYRRVYTSTDFLTFNWVGLSQGEDNLFSILSELNSTYKELKHKNVMLLVDEGDLTLHPEWQRSFIFTILNFLQIRFSDITIRILLSTHSPLLISDLPKNNILFLDKDEHSIGIVQEDIGLSNTFAANIHSIYNKGQFLKSTTGEFASKKIDGVLKLLDVSVSDYNAQQFNEVVKIINIIGEPIVQKQLMEILESKQKQIINIVKERPINQTLEFLKVLEREIINQINENGENNDTN